MKKFTSEGRLHKSNASKKRRVVVQIATKMKLKKGDKVVVVSGKDKGKHGEITRVLAMQNRVVIDGVAMVKRHTKGGRGQTGGIVERPASIHASNVMLIDPETKKPTRVGRKLENGKMVRVATKSKTVLK